MRRDTVETLRVCTGCVYKHLAAVGAASSKHATPASQVFTQILRHLIVAHTSPPHTHTHPHLQVCQRLLEGAQPVRRDAAVACEHAARGVDTRRRLGVGVVNLSYYKPVMAGERGKH